MIYDALILISLLIVLPKWLVQTKYRGTVCQRLGLQLPAVPSRKRVIWVHMVSVGETRAMIPLVSALRQRDPDAQFYFSSVTKTGHQEALRSFPWGDGHFFLPIDLSWIMRKFVHRLRPNLLLIAESDFWLNLMRQVKKRGGRVFLINGKISASSARRFSKLPTQRLFDQIDHYLVQSAVDASRFGSVGVAEERITVTGNLKLCIQPKFLSAQQRQDFREKWGVHPGDSMITIASTHAQEEELIIPHIPKHYRMFLVARHPERFNALKIRYAADPRVVVVNEMGILSSCFELSEVAIIGGSFVPGIGGHNIFEPIQVGTPVIFGPFMDNQQTLVSCVLRENAGIQTPCTMLGQAIEKACLLRENTAKAAKTGGEILEKTIKALDLKRLFG